VTRLDEQSIVSEKFSTVRERLRANSEYESRRRSSGRRAYRGPSLLPLAVITSTNYSRAARRWENYYYLPSSYHAEPAAVLFAV
jgi:hypothetical protein